MSTLGGAASASSSSFWLWAVLNSMSSFPIWLAPGQRSAGQAAVSWAVRPEAQKMWVVPSAIIFPSVAASSLRKAGLASYLA